MVNPGYHGDENALNITPAVLSVNVFLKLRDAKIIDEKRRMGFVYSFDMHPRKIEKYVKKYIQNTEAYDAKFPPKTDKSKATFGDVIGTKASVKSSIDSKKLNITITPSKFKLEPQWAPELCTVYSGTNFPIVENGNLFVEYRSLDFHPDKNVPQEHMPKIKHIETEIKNGILEREWKKLYEETKKLGLW